MGGGPIGLCAFVDVAASVAVFGVIPAGALAESSSPYADLTARVFGASIGAAVATSTRVVARGR